MKLKLFLLIIILSSCNSSQFESEIEMLTLENESLENEISEVLDKLLSLEDELSEKIKEVEEVQLKNAEVKINVTNLSFYLSDLQNSINNGWYNENFENSLNNIQINFNNLSYAIEGIQSK